MATTQTKMGETWDMISKRVYGDEHFIDVLINANFEHRNTVLFPYGVILTVPEIDTTSTDYNKNLPPWKR